jgi:DNA (cytosine-5)-methyltransferase 1
MGPPVNGPRIGELFSGYGGLGMGVQTVLGGSIAWHSDIDPGACKILTHRYPDVPNHGDITRVGLPYSDRTWQLMHEIATTCPDEYRLPIPDWSAVEPVDILTGGSPCQDLSAAGKRAGMTEGTRSNLWVSMREAIAQLRPGLVVWENVRGALSARASSDMELAEGRLGTGDDGPVLRALGRVLGDLADLGYDASWQGLRASDVGAPHGRFRVFVIAWPAAYADFARLERRSFFDGQRRSECPAGTGRVVDWGRYDDAIRRWERSMMRPAPAPTEKGRLSARFSEWLMGLPAGWVTDVPGLSRNEQLKALGNGVVWQQAAEALRLLLPDVEQVAV